MLFEGFYSDLKGVTESVPAHNFLVIAGQLGPDNVLFTYNKAKNTERFFRSLKMLQFVYDIGAGILPRQRDEIPTFLSTTKYSRINTVLRTVNKRRKKIIKLE